MREILEKLGGNPMICLETKGDALCKYCPNRVGEDGCTTLEKVNRYDNLVAEFCNLTLGKTLTWQEFSGLVQEKILNQNRREMVCGDCQWSELCK